MIVESCKDSLSWCMLVSKNNKVKVRTVLSIFRSPLVMAHL